MFTGMVRGAATPSFLHQTRYMKKRAYGTLLIFAKRRPSSSWRMLNCGERLDNQGLRNDGSALKAEQDSLNFVRIVSQVGGFSGGKMRGQARHEQMGVIGCCCH